MLDLKFFFFYFTFFLDRPPARIWVIWVQIQIFSKNGNIAMSQVNRTCTLNKSLGVADVSEVLSKSFEENTLMTHGYGKVRKVFL